MEDFYGDGFDIGYGKNINRDTEFPSTDYDKYNYRKGIEDGRRRRSICDEDEDGGHF